MPIENAMGEVFSFLNILKVTSSTSGLRKWLRQHHDIKQDSEFFIGHRFFLDTCIKCLIGSLAGNSALGLDEDRTFSRARFVGVPIADLPSTCEKALLIKNIWISTEGVRKSRNWSQAENAASDLEEMLMPFDEVYGRHTISSLENTERDEALRAATASSALIFLNDTRRGFPMGQLRAQFIKPVTGQAFLESAYKGYVHTLQYLWLDLLGEAEFGRSCLVDLHRADEIQIGDGEDEDESISGLFVLPKKIHKGDADKAESEKSSSTQMRHSARSGRLLRSSRWLALDRFFDSINENIVRPLESRCHARANEDNSLVLVKTYDKKILQDLLAQDRVPQPEYLDKKDWISVMKKLDYHLLWYGVSVLNAEESAVFNGVPAFISTLAGEVEKRRTFKSSEKVMVRIFKHPVNPERPDDCDYTYCILIEAYGSLGITDYSGWLVFFDCACNYSGFGIDSYKTAREFIDRYRGQGLVDCEEIAIDKGSFKKHLVRRSISSVFDTIVRPAPFVRVPKRMEDIHKMQRLSLSTYAKRLAELASSMKGTYLELLFYHWLVEERGKDYLAVQLDARKKGEQIDVLAEKSNSKDVCFFECKVSIHVGELQDILEQIDRKRIALQKSMPSRNIRPCLVVFSEIPRKYRELFRGRGVHVISPFRCELDKWEKLTDEFRRRIYEVLEFGMSSSEIDLK